jgi:hypothetical protein
MADRKTPKTESSMLSMINRVRNFLDTSPENSQVKGPRAGMAERAEKSVGSRRTRNTAAGMAARDALMKATGAKRKN